MNLKIIEYCDDFNEVMYEQRIHGNIEIVTLLLAAGAQVNKSNHEGVTPLDLVCKLLSDCRSGVAAQDVVSFYEQHHKSLPSELKAIRALFL